MTNEQCRAWLHHQLERELGLYDIPEKQARERLLWVLDRANGQTLWAYLTDEERSVMRDELNSF